MKDIVDVAIGEIGYKEQGSNKTKYGEYTGANGAAWCHSFVSWCAHEAGVSTSTVPKTASTTYGMQWFQKKEQFKYKGKYTPKRCDIVYFKTNRNHVGIVESVSGGQLHTIEGNTSNKVARRSYSLNDATITGYGIPKYAETNGNGSSSSKKKNSKKELQYLQKVLSRHATKAKTIKASEVETGKIPAGNVMITVNNGKKKFTVPAEDGAKVVWERDSTPGKFTFTAKVEKGFSIGEGNEVLVTVDGKKFFYGFVFTKEVKKDGMASYTVYDQLRYLKNKETIVYKKKTAGELIRILAKRFNLRCGTLADTGWRRSAIEDNSTLFDIIQNALDDTLIIKGKIYVLYDEVGKLQLTDAAKMKVNTCLVDAETGQDYSYKTTIDSDVYNQIKLVYENKEKGTFDLYVTKDSKNIGKWGTLQYLDKIDNPDIGKLKSKALLKLYDKKKRTLTISGVIGNLNVRGGSLVPVMLDLGDITVANYMLVEKVTHTFKNREYTMDLVVSGGDFSE
nr:MAG TPA: 43 kDa tail protein [Caudoviricetes sp.]